MKIKTVRKYYYGIMLLSLSLLLSGCIKIDMERLIPEKIQSIMGLNKMKEEVFSCEDVIFSSNSAKPLTSVQLGAIPSDFGQYPALEVGYSNGTKTAVIPVEVKDAGASFLVPVHPSGQVKGGKVTLSLIDEIDKRCDSVDFTIQPLPEKPGSFGKMVHLIEEVSEEHNRVLGGTLRGRDMDTGSNGPDYSPFDRVADLLKGKDNPNSLDEIINGDAPLAENFTENEWGLLDGLVEESGIIAELETYVDKLQSTEPIPESELEGIPEPGKEDKSCGWPFSKPSAETLSVYMWMQIDNEIGDAVAKETNYLSTSSALFTVSSILGSAVTLGKPNPGSGALAAMSSAIGVYETQMSALAGILPSEMVSLEFDYDHAEYLEDQVDLTGTWGNVQLVTRSKGWDATSNLYKFLIKSATGGLTNKWLDNHQTSEVTQKISDFLVDQFSSESTKAIQNAQGKKEGFFKTPPCEFGPTDISAEEFSEGKFSMPEKAPAVMTGHGTFKVRDTGEAILVVSANSDRFAKRSIFNSQFVDIYPIEVKVSPERFQGDPGEVAVFNVTVENALDASLDFTIEPKGSHLVHVKRDSESSYTVTVTTSPDGKDFPAVLMATSTSSTGLRALPGAPKRFGSAILSSGGEVTVTPGAACIQPGNAETFSAVVSDLDYKEFTWSASSGTISKSGKFTAPDAPPGTKVTITAAAVANPKITGEAEVTVGDCVCWGTASMSKGGTISSTVTEPYIIEPFNTTVYFEGEGSKARLQSAMFSFGDPDGGIFGDILQSGKEGKVDASKLDLGSIFGSLVDKATKGTDSVVIVYEDDGPLIGETGTFPALIGGKFSSFGHTFGHNTTFEGAYAGLLLNPFANFGDNVQPKINVTLEEFSEGPEPGTVFMQGRISGPVHYIEVSNEYADDVGTFSMEFRGYYDISNPFGTACSGKGW